jgi:hypothetical protein
VTNYAGYYVHQAVDHPRYLCGQCHNQDEVAYDPYRDQCTLTIEYDYSWYNGWYDRYGYYPVYGNPVYVYIDPWTWNPWVNYWYRPYYTCAPWFGWGWGWGVCYSWSYSPYYWGDCVTVYNSGYRRYRPLDRSGGTPRDGVATKTREYTRGSSMVRSRTVPDETRDRMVARTRDDGGRNGAVSVAGRGGGTAARSDYRGQAPKARSRQSFDQVAGNTGRGGLRIRENVRTGSSGRLTGTSRRHTAAGSGQQPGLVPVTRDDAWRGTTRVGGRSSRGTDLPAVGTSRGAGAGGAAIGGQDSRSRTGSGGKSVRPRTRSTRVWNATGSRNTTTRSRGGGSRDRDGSVNRTRSGSDRSSTVKPRSGGSTRKSSGSSVRSGSSSRSRSGASSSGSRGGGSRSGGSRSSGSRGGSGRR